MPLYEYQCQDCEKLFTVALSLAGHNHAKVQYTGCGSKNVEQVISSFFAKTDSKT
ncbi:MAG TPA: FmdB family zinc ribbon protein [Nitrospiria bacterium]|nr:FmdB family zinc ribbon protein [Nitrospiria bacterium]